MGVGLWGCHDVDLEGEARWSGWVDLGGWVDGWMELLRVCRMCVAQEFTSNQLTLMGTAW